LQQNKTRQKNNNFKMCPLQVRRGKAPNAGNVKLLGEVIRPNGLLAIVSEYDPVWAYGLTHVDALTIISRGEAAVGNPCKA